MQGSDIEMKKEYLLQIFLVMNQDLGRDWHYAPLAHWFPEHQLAGDMTGPLRLHNGKEAMNLGNPIFFFFFFNNEKQICLTFASERHYLYYMG